MPLAPEGLFPLVAFALIVGATGFIAVSRVPKALALAVLLVGVFLVQSVGRGIIPELGLTTSDLAAGAWWTPLTYQYLHAGFFHLIGNLVILVTAGPALEDRVGPRAFLAIYFLAGLAAAGAHVGLTAAGLVEDLPAVGASGAIFGVLTAFAVRYPRQPLPLALGLIILRMPAFVVLLIHLALNLAFMLTDTSVAWYGHFAGYFVGFGAALAFEKRMPRNAPPGAVGARAMPNVDRLRPLAATPALREMLDKAEKFRGDVPGDLEFAHAWVDRFLARVACPNDGGTLRREGARVLCERGDYSVDLRR